ncbi:hypothetical protein EGW08_022489 [Elysia chlorotica]|uniref:SSD domain-containing protein n=1 Tax=Elysia chlorotica TaxID=188477 RepID=A0A3S0Z367_ELYCH|nr:hypothetical protein EGW08_022489 [Elysia chlorotica]
MYKIYKIGQSGLCSCSAAADIVEQVLQDCNNHEDIRRTVWSQLTHLQSKLYGSLDDLEKTAAIVSVEGIGVKHNSIGEQEGDDLRFLQSLISVCYGVTIVSASCEDENVNILSLSLVGVFSFYKFRQKTVSGDKEEVLYAPMHSRAIDDRATVEKYFPEQSGHNFDLFSQNRLVPVGFAIFRSRKRNTIFDGDVLEQMRAFRDDVTSITVTDKGRNYTYSDLCTRSHGACYVDGSFLLTQQFKAALDMGFVKYPIWTPEKRALNMRRLVGGVEVSNGSLKSASSIQLAFTMRRDTPEMERLSLKWELEYLRFMKNVNLSKAEVAYSVKQSLDIELDNGTHGDAFLFALTFAFMITYAMIASSGGDCVSTRALLANAGVLATGLGIFGAFGLMSASGVSFVNISGIMPFLTLGIGVDDMFLLMSGWSETLSMQDLTVPERIGTVFKKAGIGITITSAVTVLLCYICNASIFGACLTLHGRRVFSRRHTLTCLPVSESRDQLQAKGGACYAMVCGGQIPTRPTQDQSICEKGPQTALTKMLMFTPVRVLILLLFAVYIGVAVWGCTRLKQGLDLSNLVLTSSYFYKYQTWLQEDFGEWVPVSFVTVGAREYSSPEALQKVQDLLSTAHHHVSMDADIESCWLTSLASTDFYNTSSDSAFIAGLHEFLSTETRFLNDVVFDSTNETVIAARCHVSSTKLIDSNDESNMMTGARDIADASPADVFAYAEAFVLIEQYVTILYSTFKTVVMLVVTIVFLPQPVIVALVMFQVISILVGIFGFMAHWDLTLSSVTMVLLIMSVGFSVDFCAHVCTAYMVSDETSRHARALDAIVHAAGPILNGGFSSMLGVLVLSVTESYIFKAFFKVMFLVVTFGAAHAILLVPVLLSFIGPDAHMRLEKSDCSDQRLIPTPGALSSSGEGSASYGSVANRVIVIPPSSRNKYSPVISHDGEYTKNSADSLDESGYQFENNTFHDEANQVRHYIYPLKEWER